MKCHVYSIGSQLNGIIEKILRNIYYDKTKENKYVNSKNATLHNLISSKEVIDVLAQNNCDCLDYYLLNRNGVGKNLRNIFLEIFLLILFARQFHQHIRYFF